MAGLDASKFLSKLTGEDFSFSLAIRAYRTREELTQQELADLVGVKKSYISLTCIRIQKNKILVDQADRIIGKNRLLKNKKISS